MKRRYRTPHAAGVTVTCLALLSSACALEGGDDVGAPAERTGETSQAIASEITGKAEILGRFMTGNPDRLRATYATGRSSGGCSGTMIGPNMMMTASHCGAQTQFQFITYNHESAATPTAQTETFTCSTVLTTFPETDLSLAYCEPNAAGEHPGIKYGYADFDLVFSGNAVDLAASRRRVAARVPVYSSWWNPIDNQANASHLLYSEGTVKTNGITGWFSPSTYNRSAADGGQCGGEAELRVGVSVDMTSRGGCSGSSVFRMDSNRILAGPTSTADDPGPGINRNMLPIVEYLARGVVQTPDAVSCGSSTRTVTMVDGAALRNRWGLTAANFRGIVDANNSGVFDIQESIEAVDGERQRPEYVFDFSSARSNRLWSMTAEAIDTARGAAYMTADAAGWLTHATHRRLRLKADTRYHVSFRASSNRTFAVCLGDDCAENAATPRGTSDFTRYSAILASGNGELRLRTLGNGTTTIDDLVIVEMGTTHGFSTADARKQWSASGVAGTTTASVIPLGRRSTTAVDFAAMVRAGNASLSSASLPFAPGRSRVCFDVRTNPLDPIPAGQRRVRVIDDGRTRTDVQFPASAGWTSFCTPAVEMTSANGTLEFSLESNVRGSYLVDNVRIEALPPLPGTQAPVGYFDDANEDRVVGWAFDPDHSTDSLPIHVYVDDVFRAEGVANVARPDVNAVHNITGAHGFDIPVDILALGRGQHKVTVHAIDPDGTGNPPIAPTPRFVTVAGTAPHGWIEAASSDRISGWAADPDSGAPIAVHIYVDGVGVAVMADGWRPDVGAHGFHWTPPALAPGSHHVVVYAIGVDRLGRGDNDNPQLSGSPKVYYEGQFEKPGNNGTATCTTFCEGPQWGEVGGCVSGARTDTGAEVGCFTRPGLLANGQLLCQCERGWVKPGNNGTVSCGTFCDGAQWGPVGRCVGATRTDTGEQLGCGVVPGLLDGQLTCQCVNKLILQ